ncbi:MAG: OmpA family protein [Firmicutes bacterium]|nr:OmpA family protein [Bacillota bacterium]
MRTGWLIVLGWLALPAGAAAQSRTPASGAVELHALEIREPGGALLGFASFSGSTEIVLRGIGPAAGASGKLKAEARAGTVELELNSSELRGLPPPSSLGRDFLTYVLWSVNPAGRATNLGELVVEDGRAANWKITAPAQTFWLLVTAEPHFAVSEPSAQAVLYSLAPPAGMRNAPSALEGPLVYFTHFADYSTAPAPPRPRLPRELLQAQKAIELANAARGSAGGVQQAARIAELLAQAERFRSQAEQAFRAGQDARRVAQLARTATELAEAGRALATGAAGDVQLRRLEQQQAETRAETERLRAALAAAERQSEELARQLPPLRERAEAAEQRLAEFARQLESLEAAFQRDVRELHRQLESGAAERERICGALRRQLETLGTWSSQQGVLTLTLPSDALFASGSYELEPEARELLARLAALAPVFFPGDGTRYIGHTDRVGEADYNQWLSEQRALSVYRFFLEWRRNAETDPAARQALEQQIARVQRILAVPYFRALRERDQREQALVEIGVVEGRGEREVLEDTGGPSATNRRVELLFPRGDAAPLCSPPTPPPAP